ncbi:signal transduction histidine kinase [Pelomonas saccharophila]|uniref:histidine kinase n=1 Tax=Roseateles saccharophilus TaxID=304 RepID=A0ABU1YMY1_ROSSA|nr:ATP-binding protein [Roseateles saccharophilus]MDR7270213.1 signal transduction histidine kinase [Roseateles saccharophilus]
MKALVWLRQPSLMRRTAGAIALAFVLVLGVLLVHDYLETRQAYVQDLAIRNRAELWAPELAALPDVAEAERLMTSLARINERWRGRTGQPHSPVVYQLRDASGQVRAAYPPESMEAFAAGPEPVTQQPVYGLKHWVVLQQAGPWQLVIAEPAEPLAPLLWRLADDILDKLLLALPLVVLPVGLALWTGLSPLRRLTRALAARAPQDLSPLGVQPPHRELRPLAEAFEGLLAQLRRKLERERRFVQEAAHELRTPLAAVTTQAHVLAHAEAPEDRIRAEAAMVQMLQRASHLSQQLLDLAVLDDATGGPAQAVDLVPLLEQALAAASDTANAHGLELSLDAPEALQATLQLQAWQSVLHNLLDNALRYVPAGGRIEVALRQAREGIELSVADDGPGLPAEWQERAFDRFWRAPGQQVSGSGLGLAIVRQAACRLGGQVSVTQGLGGRGIAFVLSLPKSA